MPKFVCKILFGEFSCLRRSEKPVEDDEGEIKALVNANLGIIKLGIADKLNLSNSIIHDHKKCLGSVSKLDICMPKVITERNFLIVFTFIICF